MDAAGFGRSPASRRRTYAADEPGLTGPRPMFACVTDTTTATPKE